MSGRRSGARLVARLMLVAGLVAAGATALAGPAAAASPWASVTLGTPSPNGFFNPDVLDFSIPVTIAAGSGVTVRFAVDADTLDDVPPVPTVVLTESGEAVFADLPDDAVVVATACDSAEVCGPDQLISTYAVRTPRFSFYLPTSSEDDPSLPPIRSGGEVQARGSVLGGNAIGAQDSLAVTYALRTAGSADPIAQGPATVAPFSGDGTQLRFTFTAPEGMADGTQLDLALTATLTGPRFGSLSQTVIRRVVVDAGVLGLEVKAVEDLLYPVRDRYLDRSHLTVWTGEAASMTVQVLDRRGRPVARLAPLDQRKERRFEFVWDGRMRSGSIAPPGRYRYAALAKDRRGNVDTVVAAVRVAAGRMVTRKSVITMSARQALVDSYAGSCSRLRNAGAAVALESQVRCTNPRQSVVVGLFGVRLPRTPEGIAPGYAGLRVEVDGRGLAGRRPPYAVMQYVTATENRTRRVQFDGRARRHAGAQVADPRRFLFRSPDGAPPSFFWEVGLSEGSHWLAERFVVTISHRTLVETGAGRVSARAAHGLAGPTPRPTPSAAQGAR